MKSMDVCDRGKRGKHVIVIVSKLGAVGLLNLHLPIAFSIVLSVMFSLA